MFVGMSDKNVFKSVWNHSEITDVEHISAGTSTHNQEMRIILLDYAYKHTPLFFNPLAI